MYQIFRNENRTTQNYRTVPYSYRISSDAHCKTEPQQDQIQQVVSPRVIFF